MYYIITYTEITSTENNIYIRNFKVLYKIVTYA